MKCPFFPEFGKWIVEHKCPYLRDDSGLNKTDGYCSNNGCGRGGAWCTKMVGRAMLAHKVWIGNDY